MEIWIEKNFPWCSEQCCHLIKCAVPFGFFSECIWMRWMQATCNRRRGLRTWEKRKVLNLPRLTSPRNRDPYCAGVWCGCVWRQERLVILLSFHKFVRWAVVCYSLRTIVFSELRSLVRTPWGACFTWIWSIGVTTYTPVKTRHHPKASNILPTATVGNSIWITTEWILISVTFLERLIVGYRTTLLCFPRRSCVCEVIIPTSFSVED